MSNARIDKLLDDSYYHSYPKSEAIRSDLKQALLKDLLGLEVLQDVPEEDKINRHIRYYSFAKAHNQLLKDVRQSITNYINGENK